MAHYALLDENNIVVNVIVGFDEIKGQESLNGWEDYYSELFGMRCKRTSYNTRNGIHLLGGNAFRGNYAGIGYSYDETLDAFIPPKRYDSWILDTSTYEWKPPIPYPNDYNSYIWDEESVSWIKEA
jgi:hypothetical protein